MQIAITGLPEWITFLAVSLLLLVTLAYLVIPFTVIGYGARLQDLEDQLDQMRLDIRELTSVLAEQRREAEGHLPALPRRSPGGRHPLGAPPTLTVHEERRWAT